MNLVSLTAQLYYYYLCRLVLGAISPLMYSALSPYLEEGEDHVLVHGIKSETVTSFLTWVYKGLSAMLRNRIRHYVYGSDPNPSIIKQKKLRNLDFCCFVTSL
jgi:hypothetical protein